MAKIKVGINGFGRIGRTVFKAWYASAKKDFDIVAANDLDSAESSVHLLKYDSVHGRFNAHVSASNNVLTVGEHSITFFKETDPAKIGWDVDIVIDSTGRFTDGKTLSPHLKGRTKKVILCAPGKEIDGTFVIGINHKNFLLLRRFGIGLRHKPPGRIALVHPGRFDGVGL
jgi:glyceraldehyde-3-phosphate dehydrogenase type I